MKQRIEHMKDKGSFLKDYQTNMMKAAGSKGIDTKDPKQIPSPLNILFLPAITVKFREGTAARLDGKTGKLFPNQFSTEDNQLLDRLKLNQKTAQEGMDFANDGFNPPRPQRQATRSAAPVMAQRPSLLRSSIAGRGPFQQNRLEGRK